MTSIDTPTIHSARGEGLPPGIRLLYLHGFASSPHSSKAVRFAAHAEARFGLAIERLDLRVPSFEHLRLSEMIRVVIERIGAPQERVVVMGSSLGGLTAAHVAAADPRVVGTVLLAPAFRIAETWEKRLGAEGFRAWEASGWLEVEVREAQRSEASGASGVWTPDQERHANGQKARVDFGFMKELQTLTRSLPDVRVPTLVVHGSNDDVVPPLVSEELANERPFVRRMVMNDGHELKETMDAWLPAVDEFLSPFFGVPR